ncbi:hypothetical protein ACLIBH_01700 [Virgibacillus sp. W0430]|uniref:hypothetical protein n=1 Tax=Virgibacillus sp. W0430 TaxID=3391580 RepID=UPI003F4643E4
MKKVFAILTSLLFVFSMQSYVQAEDRAAASSTFEMSAAMKDTLAISLILIVTLLSWILAKNYNKSRHNPASFDPAIGIEEKAQAQGDIRASKASEQAVKSTPVTTISSPPAKQSGTLAISATEQGKTNKELIKANEAPKQEKKSGVNLFTIIALVLLIGSAFLKGPNQDSKK